MKTNYLTKKVVTAFLAVIILSLLQGCMYYYKVQTANKVTSQGFHVYNSMNKYLIVHQGDSAWHLTNLGITDSILSGNLSTLDGYRYKFRNTKPTGGNRYKYTNRHDESYVLDEVHLYLKDALVPKFVVGDYIRIDYSFIQYVDVYQKAQGRTNLSWALPIVTPIVIIGGAIGIIALTKSSCPLIYIKKDNKVAFAGEIFGGAVYSSLERHDYLPLPGFKPSKNRYDLIISNGLPEIQYINLAELWIVKHPENVTVLPDRQGVIHTISKPETPTEAVSSAKTNLLSLVTQKDQLSFHFDEDPGMTGDTCAFNTACLSFTVPLKADTGKLIIKAGNSVWGDYSYGEFTKLFGNKYGEWIKKQGKEPAEKNKRWKLDQRFALMVYLETNTGWQFVDYFDLIGPLGTRDLIMPVDLSNARITNILGHERSIRIKLESGFKFWDLDYAAMDFTRDTPFTIDYVKPSSATTESGMDVIKSLTQNDSLYYIQENTGDEGLVVFQDSPEIHNMKKSVFLHTKGYYEHVRNYPNPPDKKQLLTFLVPGRFSEFSFDNYTEFRKMNYVFAEDQKLP